jgi:hypothetical protein
MECIANSKLTRFFIPHRSEHRSWNRILDGKRNDRQLATAGGGWVLIGEEQRPRFYDYDIPELPALLNSC